MKFNRLIIAIFLVLFMCSSSNTQKFNILIIGDSISIGYTPYVKTAMADVANIVHNTGNAQASNYGVSNIKSWLGSTHWDVIQFNFGLWDVAYRLAGTTTLDKVNGILTATPAQYKANLELIVQELIKTNAKLIFVNTTYIPVAEPGRIVGDENVYNAAALEVMNKYGIQVNNITSKSKNIHLQNGLGTNNVHYNATGYQQLADLITTNLNAALVGMTPYSPPIPSTSMDRYVSPTGSDITGDGTQSNPYFTVHKAYAAAADGDVIYVAAGTYTASPAVVGGTYIAVDKSVTIMGAGAGNTILQLGITPVSATDTEHGRYFEMTTGGKTLTLEDITLRNCGWWGSANMGGAVLISMVGTAGAFTARRCNFEGNFGRYGGFLHCPNTATAVNVHTFEDCYFGENFAMPQNAGTAYTSRTLYGGGALNFGAYASAILKNCIFHKNGTLDNYANYALAGNPRTGRAIGINATDIAAYTSITNCTFIDNVAVGAAAATVVPALNISTTRPFKFMNNIVVDNTAIGSTAAIDIYSNITYSAAATAFANCKGNVVRTFSIDPLFTFDSTNSFDPTYTKTSSAVDIAGGNTPAIILTSSGVKTIKATGTKVLAKGVFDADVKSIDINGITRDPSVDVGAVQSSFSITTKLLPLKFAIISLNNKKATICLQESGCILVYDALGKLLFSKQALSGIISIPFSCTGWYFLSFYNDKKTEVTKIYIN